MSSQSGINWKSRNHSLPLLALDMLEVLFLQSLWSPFLPWPASHYPSLLSMPTSLSTPSCLLHAKFKGRLSLFKGNQMAPGRKIENEEFPDFLWCVRRSLSPAGDLIWVAQDPIAADLLLMGVRWNVHARSSTNCQPGKCMSADSPSVLYLGANSEGRVPLQVSWCSQAHPQSQGTDTMQL